MEDVERFGKLQWSSRKWIRPITRFIFRLSVSVVDIKAGHCMPTEATLMLFAATEAVYAFGGNTDIPLLRIFSIASCLAKHRL